MPASRFGSALDFVRHVYQHMREDVATAIEHDPAARSALEVALAYPGVHALWGHRVAHALWQHQLHLPARLVAHLNRFTTGVEIHPGASIGRGVFIDHGMGIVVGETTTIGDGCLLYAGIVLGGTSLEKGPRHPQLGRNVVVGSHACILGHIPIGDDARIGSGSVVVRPVPAGATVVGVPGRVVQSASARRNRVDAQLDHANLPDPVTDMIRTLAEQNERLLARLELLERQLGIDHAPHDDSPHDDPFTHVPLPHTHGG